MDTTAIYDPTDTICAISTPHGAGAIAIIRLSGKDAVSIADSIWQGKSLTEVSSHTAHLGYLIDPTGGETIDQAVATVFRSPGTFTGEDIVELSIHGSRWIQRRLLEVLVHQGARMALPGEYTQRAFAAGRLDLAQAEAVADVIAATSEASHRLAINQMRGDFSRQIGQLRDRLIELASLLELELDFSEEDVEFASRRHLLDLADETHSTLARLARSFSAGSAIKDGIPIAIIGATNAGKSSLLNAIVGDDRAIVSDIHGTTRDIVEDTVELGPYLIRLRDTAGLRDTADTIESIGIDRSRQAARKAEVIVYVIDSTSEQTIPAIEAEIRDLDPARIIFALNKADIAPDHIAALKQRLTDHYPKAEALAISAMTKLGINQLLRLIRTKIERILDHSEDSLVVTNARHAEALTAAAASAALVAAALRNDMPADLIAQDLRATIHHLSTITGAITTDHILASIFQNFCIGK